VGRPADRQSPEGRLRKEIERTKRCCRNCAYASRPCGRWFRLVLARWAILLCANSADAPGEIRAVPGCHTCPNFRRRREPVVRTAPPDPPDDRVCFVPLTQGYYAAVDAADFQRVNRYKWCLSRSGHQLYAQRRTGGRTIRMHQFIMNPPKGRVVDHVDGNGLNNRRENLRICTRQQNAWNCRRRKQGHASSQFIGVCCDKRHPDRFYAKIKCGDLKLTLGPFDTPIEAARARDAKAVELHGKFACLNFPKEV
jgi:hypothetical protein